MIIPSLCPELPEKQKAALVYGAKVPLVYTNVALRNWTALHQLGVRTIAAPGCFHHAVSLHEPISIGTYRYAHTPEAPVLLRLVRTPCQPGLPAREQHRLGRLELLTTPFATFERHIRDELSRMLAPAGFDPARDIVAITVNRWPHGYAYEYNPLWDPEKVPEDEPCVIARQPFGRITIANSMQRHTRTPTRRLTRDIAPCKSWSWPGARARMPGMSRAQKRERRARCRAGETNVSVGVFSGAGRKMTPSPPVRTVLMP